MDSSLLEREQIERLRHQVADKLHYVGRLARRMERVGFPPDDAVYLAAIRAHAGLLDLHVAIHYCGCDRGRRDALARDALASDALQSRMMGAQTPKLGIPTER